MSEQANTIAAAEVSSEYLSDIRLRVRSSVDKLDGEIKDLILAARADLVRGGVLPARAADETDPLVKQAISTYVKAEFGLDNDDADKYRASFRTQIMCSSSIFSSSFMTVVSSTPSTMASSFKSIRLFFSINVKIFSRIASSPLYRLI